MTLQRVGRAVFRAAFPLQTTRIASRKAPPSFASLSTSSKLPDSPLMSSKSSPVEDTEVKVEKTNSDDHMPAPPALDDDDYEMEQEEMFVEAYEDFEFQGREWGGPRRGGRLPEPTRYGDWERKGRCTDF